MDLTLKHSIKGQTITMSSKQDSERNGSLAQRAANLAMLTGAVAGVQQTTAVAQDATAEELNEIIVTGSRIRRLDGETANPVQIVTAATIKESGVANIGELIQKLPSIGGAATNPSVNNGGGDGASNVELRGLGAERTLVLLNGRRYGVLGNTSSAVDINSIPINMIERVEVLKQGAGAIYGSDAIGGVVNFITKTSMEGAEIAVDYGESSESDGQRKGVSLSWGVNDDTGNLILGFNYNEQEAISAGDRAFSRNAIYFYGSVFEGGSSRAPTGRVFFDTPSAVAGWPGYGLPRVRGQQRRHPEWSRQRNHQPHRFPVLRGVRHTQRLVQLPALQPDPDPPGEGQRVYAGQPQDQRRRRDVRGVPLQPDDVGLPDCPSALRLPQRQHPDLQGQYLQPVRHRLWHPGHRHHSGPGHPGNSGGPGNPNATFRLESLGNRAQRGRTWQGQFTGGLKGSLFDTGWNWDASGGYGRMDQDREASGYLFKSGFPMRWGRPSWRWTAPHLRHPGSPDRRLRAGEYLQPERSEPGYRPASITGVNTDRYDSR